MKILFALTLLLFSFNAHALSTNERVLEIACLEAAPLGNPTYYYVEIRSEAGRAANHIIVGQRDTYDPNKATVEIDQLIVRELVTRKGKTTLMFIAELQEDGYLNYLEIDNLGNGKKLRSDLGVYVGKKDGKQFAVPLRCTEMN